MSLCECGCGKEAKEENRFIKNHYNSSRERIEKIKVLTSNQWQRQKADPIFMDKFRKRNSEIKMGWHHSDETKSKVSKKLSGRRPYEITPDIRKKIIETQKRRYAEGKYDHLKKMSSERMKGRTPWNKGLTKENDERVKHASEKMKGRKRSESHQTNLSKALKGKNSGAKCHLWKGGISVEPYTIEFSESLKEQIRTRDQHRCQQCFRHQSELRDKNNRPYKLNVHHINYDKKDSRPENLISLCQNCHSQTNFSREDWTEYFKERMI